MKTKNLMVGILAGVLVLALWWTMLLKPARTKADKVREETAAQQSKLDPLEIQLRQAQQDAAHAATFKAQLDSLQKAMPDSPALAAFIRNANDIAAASGVSWQSVTHGLPTVGLDGATSIALGIQVKGTYAQVQDYQARLAALDRLVVVDGVQLSTAASTGAGASTDADPSGQTTGPFSGGDELSAVVSARMFEAPSAPAPATDATGAPTAPAGATSAPAAAK